MSYNRVVLDSPESNNEIFWTECNCCPYGCHIDLDFVRYCEELSRQTESSETIKRRKARSRQRLSRQSREVLLGFQPSTTPEQNYKGIVEKDNTVSSRKETYCPLIQDGFEDAVYDFERTLQRSKNKRSNNLPDIAVSEPIRRASSSSSISSTSGSSLNVPLSTDGNRVNQDFDTMSESSWSPAGLQIIREQLVLSLERTKQLEEQARRLPALEEENRRLKEEKRLLTLQLTQSNVKSGSFTSFRSSSDATAADASDGITKLEAPIPPPRKDFGVMCSVLTRNVGVGHQNPNTKHASTTTINGDLASKGDRWYSDKEKFMNLQNSNRTYISKSSQTIIAKDKREVGVNCVIEKPLPPSPTKYNASVQVTEAKKISCNVGVLAKPKNTDFSAQKEVKRYSIGCSEDTIDFSPCENCSVSKVSIGVGGDIGGSVSQDYKSVSLASLNVRSKSFNLGEEKLQISKKSTGTQFDPNSVTRASQTQVNKASKNCQTERKLADKNIQYESNSVSKETETSDLVAAKKNVACEAKEKKVKTKDACLNTEPLIEKEDCGKCRKEKENAEGTRSKIPRPQGNVTPVEARKFKRQDTYTKIPALYPENQPRLSGLDLSPKALTGDANPLDTVKDKISEVSSTSQNGLFKSQTQESSQTLENQTNRPRKKAVPSKEMQGAMKVLNDSLVKNSGKNLKPRAINIVQQEWFKISSLVTANPLDVEDYLDAFEEMSGALLEYIVNVTDDTGNTAMHYAVSYGNFDVVSILLDSKVCDINKPNKAGYTSVMLVSLAEMRSQTHANVVKRLFQLADVNIRAKGNGQTALMLAVSHGRLDMVKMLLMAGADVNIQDEDGSTALMCAAEHGHIEIVRHLLMHPDCDSSITDVDGSTALTIAMVAEHRNIGVLLYTHEKNNQKKIRKQTKPASPKTPSSPLPTRSINRALTETKLK